MNPAKIRLSPAEMELVSNAELILTKNAILKKAQQLLENIQLKQQEVLIVNSKGLPAKVSETTSKISKGENYKGLPYLVLDYPRLFEHENLPDRQSGIFAIRTMFWWGNFFSVTLHLTGIYKKGAEEKIIASYHFLKEKGFYCYINEDQWEHHFEGNNYILLSEMNETDFENTVRERSFIKITNKISLQKWDDAQEILLELFKNLLEILTD